MKKGLRTILWFLLISLLALLLSGCVSVGFGPAGALFTSTTVGIYGTEVGGNKSGKACVHSILSLVAFGNGSVESAARAGGIQNIKSIDLDIFSILMLYGNQCTVVRGD